MKREVVTAIMRNRRTTLTYPFPDEIPEFFSFMVPNHRFMPAAKRGWNGSICLMRGSRVPTGLFLSMRREIEGELQIEFEVDDRRKIPDFRPLPERLTVLGFEVRAFQERAVRRMIRASGTGGLLLNATGTGKTFIAGLYLRYLKGSAIFVVDELTLASQARDELEAVLQEEVGMIGESKFRPRRVSVATIQTLYQHRWNPAFQDMLENLEVLFIDEIHLMLNRRQEEVVHAFPAKAVFGLTATLELAKESVRYPALALCGPVLYTYSYEQAVTEKYLAPGVVIGVDLARTTAYEGEEEGDFPYHERYTEAIVNAEERNAVIEDLVREGIQKGKSIAVLVERVHHLKKLSSRLSDIPHEAVYGDRITGERLHAKKQFEAGHIRLLIANKVFKKGINLKRLDMIIDAAAMKNPNDAIQKFGRGVRLFAGKRGLLYLDIGDRKLVGKRNHFSAATARRRRAFVKAGIPVLPLPARVGAAEILEQGEKFLRSNYVRGA